MGNSKPRCVQVVTHVLHRLFVNVQFLLVAFQSTLYVCSCSCFPRPNLCSQLFWPPGCGTSRLNSCKLFLCIWRWRAHLLSVSTSMVILRKAPRVCAHFIIIHVQFVDSRSSHLMEWTGQFAVSITYHSAGEHISSNSVSLLTCSG